MTLQGRYHVDRIEMRSSNVAFVMNVGSEPTHDLGVGDMVNSSEEGDIRSNIHCFAAPDGLQAKVVPSHLISLGDMRTLEVELDSGRNEIEKGTIRVRPATAGLRIRVADAQIVQGEIKINNDNDAAGNIEFSGLPSKSFVRFRIPYTIEENHSILSAKLEIFYQTDRGLFSYSSVSRVNSALPISVNVQDIFKDDALFSRFTVGPAMMTPLRILACDIPSSDAYEVQSSVSDSGVMDVFPKQPASLLYKVTQRADGALHAADKSSLRLTVEFTCVDDESLDAIERAFRRDIEASKWRQYATLLVSHLVGSIRARLSASEMEVVGLIREVEVPSFQTLQWEGLLGALNSSKDDVRNWLVEWHRVSA